MARRSVVLTTDSPSATVGFGSDSNTLRVVQQTLPHVGGTEDFQNARVVLTVNTGAAPDANLSSTDDDTRMLSPDGLPSEFTESAPSGPWDVRLALIPRGGAPERVVVELDEF